MNFTSLVSNVSSSKLFRTSRLPNIKTHRRLFSDIAKEQKINEISFLIENHPALNHPYFSFLQEQSKIGFTPTQAQIQRDNYLFGCFELIPSLAKALIASAKNQDNKSIAILGKNIFEETGQGKIAEGHPLLAEHSFNIHTARIFNLPSIKLKQITNSPFITPQTRNFIAKQAELYDSTSYPIVLGTSYADEYSSLPSMKIYYETFFLPYKSYHSEKLYEEISKYWLLHLGGMEAEHIDDIKLSITQMCHSQKDIDDVRKGAIELLDAQKALFDGMLSAMEKAAKIGSPVSVHLPYVKAKNQFVELVRINNDSVSKTI